MGADPGLTDTEIVIGSCAALEGPASFLGTQTVLGALAFAGLGMLVASRARTIEAVSGLMNLVMLPMWILSGTFFSYARFPDAMQPFVKALPLTALNDALRAVMIDGTRLGELAVPLGIVTAWGVQRIRTTADFREGITSFLEKRKPVWSGK